MQVLIIEDEPRAARQLQSLLQACNFQYQLLEIIDSVEEAVLWFQKQIIPDLVFMDIQLADGLSFEIFQQLRVEAPIIFTTAFDQYAIQAFKVNSIDYLLKPIQKNDLTQALDKFTSSNTSNTIDPSIVQQLLQNMQQGNGREGILVKDGKSFVQLKIKDVLYFYSENSITFGVTATKQYIVDETIDQLYDTLDHEIFFKINRGQLVVKNAIERIDPYFNHRVKLTVTKAEGQEFVVSRQRTQDFKDWMNR